MTNKTYDILAWIGRLLLPATATLVLGVFKIWGLPYGEAIAGTISAVAFFLNSILKKNSIDYEVSLVEDMRDDDDRSDDAPVKEEK